MPPKKSSTTTQSNAQLGFEAKLTAGKGDDPGANPEDSDKYRTELFNNRRWHYWISKFSNGTTINMVPIDALEMPLLVVPPKELVKQFTAIAQAAHDQIENNLHQPRTLATLRDTLLPKLLSGELSIPAAE
jgi:hypothetical protein